MPIEKRSRILPQSLALESTILGREVQVDLYFPQGHPADTAASGEMNLLLINDGQDLAKLGLAELLDSLYSRGVLAPLLCAGIHAGTQRKKEYGTAGLPDHLGRGNLAAAYTSFILEELLPCLDGIMPEPKDIDVPRFREKAFAGFSLGALSALDIVWNHSHEFTKAGLFSGSFWWRSRDKDDPAYRDETDRIMHCRIREGSYHPGLKFFFECGTEDEKEDRNQNGIIDSIDDTRDLIGELVMKGYEPVKDIYYLELQEGKHDVATWARAMPEFLEWGWGNK